MPRPLVLVALVVALAAPASAQAVVPPAPLLAHAAPDAPDAERYRIRVGRQGGQCVYHIRGAEDQDAFTVAPGDEIRVQSRGRIRAFFVFADDDGVAAVRGGREVPLGEGVEGLTASRLVTVRAPVGRDTEHDVAILCCVRRGGRACAARQRAVPRGEDLGLRLVPPDGAGVSGPSASEAPVSRLGPRMVVVE